MRGRSVGTSRYQWRAKAITSGWEAKAGKGRPRNGSRTSRTSSHAGSLAALTRSSECNSAGVGARPCWPVLACVGADGRTMDAHCCPVNTQNPSDIRAVQSRSSHAGRFRIISSRYCGHGRADLMGGHSLTLPRSASARAGCGQGRSEDAAGDRGGATRTRCRREAGGQVEVPADAQPMKAPRPRPMSVIMTSGAWREPAGGPCQWRAAGPARGRAPGPTGSGVDVAAQPNHGLRDRGRPDRRGFSGRSLITPPRGEGDRRRRR
jgi:hypothetical protein